MAPAQRLPKYGLHSPQSPVFHVSFFHDQFPFNGETFLHHRGLFGVFFCFRRVCLTSLHAPPTRSPTIPGPQGAAAVAYGLPVLFADFFFPTLFRAFTQPLGALVSSPATPFSPIPCFVILIAPFFQ